MGVELDEAVGDSNGVVDGKPYFSCQPKVTNRFVVCVHGSTSGGQHPTFSDGIIKYSSMQQGKSPKSVYEAFG